MSRVKDMTGQTFGRLTVLERTENHVTPSGQVKTTWLCRCACGNTKRIRGATLRKGEVQSCGCYQREAIAAMRRASRRETAGYYSAHLRLVREFGRAKDHPCAECGNERAQAWSYDHGDPNELSQMVRGFLLFYSLDHRHYRPLCRSCHGRFDRAQKRVREARA